MAHLIPWDPVRLVVDGTPYTLVLCTAGGGWHTLYLGTLYTAGGWHTLYLGTLYGRWWMAHLIPWYPVRPVDGTPYTLVLSGWWCMTHFITWYSEYGQNMVHGTSYTLVLCTAGGGWHTLYLGTLYGWWWMAHLIPWYSVRRVVDGTPYTLVPCIRPVDGTPYTLVPCTAGGGWHTLYLGTLYGRWWMAHLIPWYSVRPVVDGTPYTLAPCIRPVDGTPYTLVPCTAGGGWHTLYLGTLYTAGGCHTLYLGTLYGRWMAHLIPWYPVRPVVDGTPYTLVPCIRPVDGTPYTLVPCTAGGGWHTLYLGTLYDRWMVCYMAP